MEVELVGHCHEGGRQTDPIFFDLLNGSFSRLLGRPLSDQGALWLYEAAPFVVLAHNTDPDPIFIYANKAAQRCFEYGWDEFLTLPSRLSAEPGVRVERQAALDAVARNGYVDDYSGIRIAKSGRRFRIADAIVWQLIDLDGIMRGQAATFADWAEIQPEG